MKFAPLLLLIAGLPALLHAEPPPRPPRQYVDTSRYTPISEAAVPMIALDTPEGEALVTAATVDLFKLRPTRVDQYKSHCGAASAVCVLNALVPGLSLDQDDLFIPETAGIITQDVVYRMGFTLEELARMLATRPAVGADAPPVRVEYFHAGSGEGEHSFEEFLAALRANRESADDQIIINYATQWLYRRHNSGGHFSPIADYREDIGKVLVLEVNPSRPSFWVDARELYDAMNQVDRVSGRVRGWIRVTSAAAE